MEPRIPLAFIPPDHPTLKAENHDGELHLGLWNGLAHQRLGHSRAHQYEILTTAGGVIYTVESHPELKVGDRVRFIIGFDKLGIEQLAVQVKPTTITSPKARESK